MKERIIEIVELGQPKSLIQRENSPITELIKTDMLIEELNEQLRLYNVVGRSEQLKAFLLFIQENAPNYRTKQLKRDQVIKAYLESL